MICIPIKQKKLITLISHFKRAQKSADITEIWFEELGGALNEKNLGKIFKQKKKPVIYKSFGDPKAITQVLKFHPEYIDLGLKTPQGIIKQVKQLSPKTKIIISFHDFQKTPNDNELKKIAKKIIAKKADIVKIATYAKNFSDTLRMLQFLSEFSKKYKVICLCMGKEGALTRTAGLLLGNYLTYAALDNRSKTAEGQLTINELKCL